MTLQKQRLIWLSLMLLLIFSVVTSIQVQKSENFLTISATLLKITIVLFYSCTTQVKEQTNTLHLKIMYWARKHLKQKWGFWLNLSNIQMRTLKKRTLTITKGNYISSQIKKQSKVLRFDEDKLLFFNEGHSKILPQLPLWVKPIPKRKKFYQLLRNFIQRKKSLREIESILKSKGHSIGKSTVSNYINEIKSNSQHNRIRINNKYPPDTYYSHKRVLFYIHQEYIPTIIQYVLLYYRFLLVKVHF